MLARPVFLPARVFGLVTKVNNHGRSHNGDGHRQDGVGKMAPDPRPNMARQLPASVNSCCGRQFNSLGGEMCMHYDGWEYRNLLNLRADLEDEIRRGQPLQAALAAANKAIGSRRFALIGLHGGRNVKEYGRWRTPQECESQAKRMGLPVGSPFEFMGLSFETRIQEMLA